MVAHSVPAYPYTLAEYSSLLPSMTTRSLTGVPVHTRSIILSIMTTRSLTAADSVPVCPYAKGIARESMSKIPLGPLGHTPMWLRIVKAGGVTEIRLRVVPVLRCVLDSQRRM